MNYQVLSVFNKDWDIDYIRLFDWIIFRGHKDANLIVEAGYREIDLFLRIERKKAAKIIKYFSDTGYISIKYGLGKKMRILIEFDSIEFYVKEIALNPSHKNYKSQCQYYINLLP